MKTKIHIKIALAMLFIIANTIGNLSAQEIIPLSPEETRNRINGDLIMTGNSIVGMIRDAFGNTYNQNLPYNGNLNNGNSVSNYIDIDGDNTTFSSSSADIITPRPDCSRIVYAGLYWSATYYLVRSNDPDFNNPAPNDIFNFGNAQLSGLPANDARKQGAADFRNIKFKVPGRPYVDITAQEVIFDGYRGTPTNLLPDGVTPNPNASDDVPYVCYSNVTNLINQSQTDGTYTVANMNATIGTTSGSDGASGGWVLVVIYEDPLESSKFISTNHGFVQINNGDAPVDFTYTGFTSLPGTLPVEVSYGVATLEGDRSLSNDRLRILRPGGSASNDADFTSLGSGVNPTNNFFNSSISFSDPNPPFTSIHNLNRNPASQNTLGFDIDIFRLPNSGNNLIENNQTNATFRLETDQDTYRVFLNSFAIEIIEPELRILKRVFDTDGVTEITNANVELGDELFYDLEIENVGNEDLVNGSVVITDILPDNVDLVSIQDATLPPGVTYTITPPSRIDFNIPASIVEETDAPIFIRFRVRLVNSCEELRDACSNRIQNSALAEFTGAISGETLTNNSSSIIGACGNTDGEATNFLVNVPACSTDVTSCNSSLQLVAGEGYTTYTWTGPGITTPIVENNHIFDVPNPQSGTYTVVKEDNTGACITLTEEFVVDAFSDITNPILSYVNGTNVISTNCSGLQIPQILLCGNQTFDLATNFDPATLNSISWQQLNPSGSCVLDSNDPCSLLSGNCTDTHWIELPGGNTANYTVSDAGDYRILAEFDGGCFIPFFFSVFKNDFQPTLDMTPIECGNDGSVSVTNAPANFEFSLTQGGPYSATTVFPITPGNGGDITVYGIDTTFPGCEYTATINVPEINPTFSVTGTNPTCINDNNGTGTGSIQIQVTNGSPEFQYTISGGTLTAPIIIPNSSANNGNYIQYNLNPGTYDVEVISNRPSPECIFNQQIIINPAPDFRAEAILLAPETCDSGALVQVNVLAGSGNYSYDIGIETAPGSGVFNPSGNFTTCNIFELPTPANPATSYTFYVSDENVPSGVSACIIEANITGITPYEPIVIDNVTVTQPACFNNDGEIRVDVSPVVAGRNYTYQLWDCASDPNCGDSANWDPSLWTIVNQIATTNNQATFTGVADGNSYAIAVVHDSTTPAIANPNCTITAPPALVCPVRQSIFSITTPDEIEADVSTDRELSCVSGSEDALILVENIRGGSGDYEWSFNATSGFVDVPSDPFTIPVTTDGSYTVYIRNRVTDDCTEDFTTPVAPLVRVTDIDFTPGDSNCTTQTIIVTPAAEPAGPAYTYTVVPAPVSGDATSGFELNRGTNYTFTATHPTNGCTYSEDFNEAVLPEIDITSVTPTPVTCFGGDNGTFTFVVANSTAFNYTVTGPSTNIIVNGATSPVTIQGPANPLGVGTYTITVTDTDPSVATNCTDTETVIIMGPPSQLTLSATPQSSNCGANTGTITATAGGGNGNFQFELRDAANAVVVGYPNTSNIFTGLAQGNYTVFVRDGNSSAACQVSTPVTVGQFSGPVIDAIPGGDVCVDTDPATQWIEITPDATTTTVGPFEYDLTGPINLNDVPVTFLAPPNDDTFEIPNLIAGSYTVVVRNTTTNCVSNVENFTINPELTITASSPKAIDCNSGATIDYTITNGIPNYTVTYSTDNFVTETNVVTNDPSLTGSITGITTAGDYVIRVLDNAGCIALSNTITVAPYETLTAGPAVITEPACDGETGSITVNVTAGNGPFTYVLDGNLATQIGPTGATTATFNGVTSGVLHTVTITDGTTIVPPATACTVDVTATLTNPGVITANIVNVRNLNCTATPDAQVQVTLGGGSGSYEWSIDGTNFNTAGTTAFPIDFATDGNYTLSVRNAATDDCLTTFPINIAPLLEITDITFAESDDDCVNQRVTVIPSAVGDAPIPAYTYNVVPAPISGDAIAGFVLNRGTNYTFTATRGDNSCTYNEDFRVELLDVIQITNAAQTQPVTCINGNDGAFTFNVDTATFPNFTFRVTGPAPATTVVTTGTFPGDPLTITGLEDGTYTIEVTNSDATVNTNCSDTETVIITEPTDPITFMPQLDQICTNNTVTVANVMGGNGPAYTYTITHPTNGTSLGPQSITTPFTGILNDATDPYTITVFDNTGVCSAQNTLSVTELPAVALGITGSELCLDDNIATIDIDITNGTPDYSYDITRDGIQVVPITPLGAGITSFTTPDLTQDGTYVITVTDAFGCSNSVTQVIAPQVSIVANLLKDLDCSVSPDAQIDIVVNGGNGATSLEININGGGYNPYVGPIPFTTTTAGRYQFRVTDSATPGCTAESAVITVTPAPNPVVLTPTITNPRCNGNADGSVTINIDTTVGTGPYAISFDGSAFTNQITYGGLVEGTYNYTVRDAKGCDETFSVNLAAPPVVIDSVNETDINCLVGTLVGEIEFDNITGGTPPYDLTLLNAADLSVVATTTPLNPVTGVASGSTVTFGNLSFGDYILRVIDSNGCDYDFTGSISTEPIFTFTIDPTVSSCADGVDITITVSGGAPPYQIREYTPGGTEPYVNLNPGPNIHIFNDLEFDTSFTFEVIDSNGCTDIQTLPPQNNPGTLDIAVTENPVTCVGDADGSINYTVTGYQGTELTYSIYRSDDLVNPITGSFTFSAGNPQTVVAAGTASGSVTDFGPGTYLVRVEETDGAVADPCNAAVEFTIVESATPLVYNGTTIIDGNCSASSQGVVSLTGGTEPYGYLVVESGDPNTGVYSSSNVVVLNQTINSNWDLYVRDANNCVLGPLPLTATVIPDPTFTTVPNFVVDPCTYDNMYELTVLATGQSQLQFGIDDGDTGTADSPSFVNGTLTGNPNEYTFTYTITSASVDNHTLTVRDQNGCTDTATLVVYDPLDISAVFTTPPSCTASDGIIEATVTGTAAGTLSFQLQDSSGTPIANTTGDVTGIYTGVPPGDYIVQVIDDGRGPNAGDCPFTTTVSIQAPPPPTIDGTTGATNMICNSDAPPTGSITVSLTGTLDPAVTYEYEITTAPGTGDTRPRQSSPTFNNLDVDTYTVRVWATLTNGSGGSAIDVVCFDDQIFNITEPAVVDATVNQGDYFDCDGNTNATIEITGVIGGSGAGYIAEVTRPDGVVLSNITITAPTTIVEAPIPGTYNIQIFDSNNCPSVVDNVVIAPYTPMFDPLVTQTQSISCDVDEIVEVSIQGGSGDFLFEVISGPTSVTLPPAIDTPAGVRLAQFFTLPAVGTYTFRITDQGDVNGLGLNCDITTTYNVPEFDLIEATAVVTPGSDLLLCNGDLTGSIDVTVLNYNGEYNYTVRNTVTALPVLTGTVLAGFTNPQTITGTLPAGIPAGIFTVEIEAVDAPNCDAVTNAVTIRQPEELTLAIVPDSDINANCNEDARVTVSVTGGTPPYTYTATAGATVITNTTTNTTNEFLLPVPLPPSPSFVDYTITVTDANSCASTPSSIVHRAERTPEPTITSAAWTDTCVFDNNYTIRVVGISNVPVVAPTTNALTFEIGPAGSGQVPGSVDGTTHDFTVTTPGTYTVRVYDENGCVSTDATVVIVPELSVSADFTGDPVCRTDTNGEITVSLTGGSDFGTNPGNFTFTLINEATNLAVLGPQASNIFAPVPAGDYRVEVTDDIYGDGSVICTTPGDVLPLSIPVDPGLSETHTAVSCVGASDGTVTITIDPTTDNGGQYTYQLFENNGGGIPAVLPPPPAQQIGVDQIDNGTFTGLSFNALAAPYPTAGEYLAVVTSDRGCLSAIEFVIPNASQVTASSSQTPYTCAGTTENFPQIIVTILDGTSPYSVTYTTPSGNVVTELNIDDDDLGTLGVQHIFTGDEVGNYVITVTDSNGCNIPTPPGPTITETINPLPIMTDPTVTRDTSGPNNGEISCRPDPETVIVSITGGTAPPTGTFDFVVITSPSGAVVLDQLGVAAGTSDNPGTAPVETNATNAVFQLPEPGLYTFEITDTVTGCSIQVSHTIEPFDNAIVTANSTSPETCFGAADGVVEISVAEYIGDFSYTIVDIGVTPEQTVHTSVANLTATAPLSTPTTFTLPETLPVGNYRVDIVEIDTPFCTKSSNAFDVEGPSVPLDVEITPNNSQESCDPGTDISFQATVQGNRGTVTYTLVETGATNSTGLFDGLSFAQAVALASPPAPAGSFGFNVTVADDVNGDGSVICTATEFIIVTPPTNDVAITAIPPGSISCYEETDGTITVSATATDTPLRYSITPTSTGTESVLQTGNMFDNLGPDTYTITVYDRLGCTAQTTAVINDVPEVTVAINVDRTVSCGNDTVDVTVTGITSAAGGITQFVMVNVTDPSTPVETPNATGIFTGITQGEYVFYVVDANGCRSKNSDPVPVVPINPINFDLDTSAANVNCRDEATGVIDIDNLTGGIGDYEFILDYITGGTTTGPQATTVFRGLSPGQYTYTARSVSDNSCTLSRNFTIDNPPLFLPTITFTDVTCNGEDNGTITITIDPANNQGTPPYSYAIDSQPGVFFNDASDGVTNQHVFENLAPGSYVVLAQDANGCDHIETHVISEPTTLQADIVGTITPETCFEASDGAITISVSGGTAPYQTNITNNDADFVQDMFTYTNLPGGTTIVYIRDANNCRVELPVVVPEGVVLDATLVPRIDCPVRDENDPSIIVQGPRYFVNYELTSSSVDTDIIFTLTGVNGTSNPVQTSNTSGEFEVTPGEYQGTMEHSGGCIVNLGNVTVEEYTPLGIPVAQMTGNAQDPNEYQITASGGRQFDKDPSYAFYYTILEEGRTVDQLLPSEYTELEGDIFTIRETADYVIRVVDAAGCEVISVQSLTYINIRIPNYFTPDSPNSTMEERFWYPRQISPDPSDPFFFENMEVIVFDRYGRMLAEFKGNNQGWDGLYQGKQLPSGDYWFTIILNDIDNREFTGHFTLYR